MVLTSSPAGCRRGAVLRATLSFGGPGGRIRLSADNPITWRMLGLLNACR